MQITTKLGTAIGDLQVYVSNYYVGERLMVTEDFAEQLMESDLDLMRSEDLNLYEFENTSLWFEVVCGPDHLGYYELKIAGEAE